MSKKNNGTYKDPNFLPESLCLGFQSALDQLVDDLAITEGFKGTYLRSEYKSKYNDPVGTSAEDRRSRAIKKWLLNEEQNSITNQRLQLGDEDLGWTTSDALICKARAIIQDVLGPLPYPGILTNFRHSNGASTRVGRGPSAAILKHGGIAHVSSKALTHWQLAVKDTRLEDQGTVPQETSVLFTVPKNAEIDRPACKEPEINMLLQRSCGMFIRSRLKRKTGIDLRDQSRNQQLAKDALRLDLATIDLSAASDSITQLVVMELLPVEWWSLLDDLRVHSTIVDGVEHSLEMFSSMGNGFTFELETLIFYALSKAICWLSGIKGKISVYGDDIIVPVKAARRLVKVFSWFGFKVNSKKSAWSGSFRESCGRHYYRGLEVTPFYLRAPVRGKIDVIRVLNRLLIWDNRELLCLTDTRIIDFHRRWATLIPMHLHGGPDPESDSSLVTGDKPRKRLIPRTLDVEFDQDLALTHWLSVKESLCVNDPHGLDRHGNSGPYEGLELKPSKQGRFKSSNHPAGTVSTAWDPYLLERVFAAQTTSGKPA